MKLFFFLFLFPFLAVGQTVHVEDNEIVYRGDIRVNNLTIQQISESLQKVLPDYVCLQQVDKQRLKGQGQIKLDSPHSLKRKIIYTLVISIGDHGFKYHIYDVSLVVEQRGVKADTTKSKKMLEQMEESGTPAIEMETILNEIDMNFQKMFVVIEKRINKLM